MKTKSPWSSDFEEVRKILRKAPPQAAQKVGDKLRLVDLMEQMLDLLAESDRQQEVHPGFVTVSLGMQMLDLFAEMADQQKISYQELIDRLGLKASYRQLLGQLGTQ
jgi:predicted N-acetyltransferase YhbS